MTGELVEMRFPRKHRIETPTEYGPKRELPASLAETSPRNYACGGIETMKQGTVSDGELAALEKATGLHTGTGPIVLQP